MSVTARATEAYTAPMSPPTSQYKGKLSNRSWQQLPPEIIRYVSLSPFPRLSRHPRLHNPPVNLARRTRIGNADSLSHFQPDCHLLPPRCHHLLILSTYLGRAGRLAIQDGLYLNPRRSATGEAHADMSALVHRSYVFLLVSCSSVFAVPVWGGYGAGRSAF